MNCSASPNLYIVFGPLGTGKTTVLVAAGCQIVQNHPGKRLLICPQSNSACDEIAERLLKLLSRGKILRLYSISLLRKIDELNAKIVSISSLHDNVENVLKMEELEHFQIVISTLVNSDRLRRAKIDPNFF